MAVMTDKATQITAFLPLQGKPAEDLASACFVKWICKLSVPQVIDTNLTQAQAEDLKIELDTRLNKDQPVH